MKSIIFSMIFTVLVITGCGRTHHSETQSEAVDSLSAQVQRFIEEKKRVVELKNEFENSRYNKSLLKYRSTIRKYAKRYGFDWRLIVAQIMQESKFREKARSPVGARGLMQLMPGTAREITRELDVEFIMMNPRENIAAGIYHLKKQYQYFPNADRINRLKLGLASYNAGAGRVFDAQDIARYYSQPINKWPSVRQNLPRLKSTDWELHLQVWPMGKPKHGYFYGYDETITYVDKIWEMYEVYQKIL
jgi:membrane-bound lytic murein transglycosylase F